MIDIENEIVNSINNAVQAYATDNEVIIDVKSDRSVAPKTFPCVYIFEYDSYNSVGKQYATRRNTFDTLVYEADVYTDSVTGRKSEAKEILAVIDDRMRILGFTRTTKKDIDLTNDSQPVKRLLARYQAEVDTKGYIYNRR